MVLIGSARYNVNNAYERAVHSGGTGGGCFIVCSYNERRSDLRVQASGGVGGSCSGTAPSGGAGKSAFSTLITR